MRNSKTDHEHMENTNSFESTEDGETRFLPLTISLETLGGIATPLVLRGTPLPTKRSQVFSTATDNQESVLVKVLVGESPIAEEDLLIAEFELVDIAAAPRDQPQIEVIFEVDPQCQIKASAMEKKSGSNISIVATDAQIRLSEDKIRELVQKAETNKERDQNRKEAIDAKNRAEHVIRNAEGYLQRYRGSTFSQTKQVERTLAALGLAVEQNDGQKIQTLVSELERIVGTSTDPGFDAFFRSFFGPIDSNSPFSPRRAGRARSSFPSEKGDGIEVHLEKEVQGHHRLQA